MSNTDDDDDNVTNVHRHVSLMFLENTKGFAVRVPRGQKDPGKGWDPKHASEAKSMQTLSDIRQDPRCNLGVHVHGDLVDVDIDSPSIFLMRALDTFLPPSGHTWGRTSRPRTHRLYTVRQEGWEPTIPFLRRIMKWEETKVEIRGGNKSRGEYSLLPGSVHPSGEMYEWADINRAQNSGTQVDWWQITDAIRKACAISILAPYWKEGIRNDLVMAFSGFLYRIFSIVGEAQEEGEFRVNHDMAETLIRTMLKVCEDDPSDEQARMKTFAMTWKKGESGAPVTGATTLKEITGDPDIARKLYAVLTDGQDMNTIEEFTARFVIWQGPGLAIDLEAAKRGEPKPYMNRQQFLNSHGHIFVNYIKADGKEGRRQLADAFWAMAVATRLQGITFQPGDDLITKDDMGKTVVNQWGGFRVEPEKGRVTQEEVWPFLEYVFRVLANNDAVVRDYLIQWIAHIFQAPGKKSKTALVLVGKPGAGKSFLGHRIISAIIGDKHSALTNDVQRLTRGFNMNFTGKIFIQCDEATNNKQKGAAAILNSLITDPKMTIEPKGVDAFEQPNHARFMFTSNDENDAIFIGHGTADRRYTIIKVSDHEKDNLDYWTTMHEWAEANLAKIHRYLLQVEIDWRLISRPLVTSAKAEMQLRSLDPFDMWLRDMVARGHPLHARINDNPYDAIPHRNFSAKFEIDRSWPQFIRYTKLVEDFQYWCRQNKQGAYVDNINEQMIEQELKKRGLPVGGGKEDRVRKDVKVNDSRTNNTTVHKVSLRPWPPIEAFRDHIAKISGVTMDLEDFEDTGVTPDAEEDKSEF